MLANYAVLLCMLVYFCVIMALLMRRLGDVSGFRRLVNLLFPLSQLLIIAFLIYYAVSYELPSWVLVLTVVIGVLCGPIDLVLFKALGEAEKRELSEERVRLLEEQLQAQEAYGERLKADLGEVRRIREDVAAELERVDALLSERETQEASQGLLHAVETMDSSRMRYCEHRVVDALVSMKAAECESAGIAAAFDLAVPESLPLSSVELCALFSNMLDNAMNACRKVGGGCFIDLKAHVDAGFLVASMKNSCEEGEAEPRGKKARSRNGRLSEHGWGLTILESLAHRHDGSLETEQHDGVFETTAILRVSE